MAAASSWGRYPRVDEDRRLVSWEGDVRAALASRRPLLARGLGRSYGDSCLNEGGTVIELAGMDRFLAFDATHGLLSCEAGASLDDVIAFALPRGWFPAVVPGTRFVTVGGCIANDVHGKNHHRAGTFGRHVRALTLLRSDGTTHECSPMAEPSLFAATVAGLGLTGIVTRATLALRPLRSARMEVESLPFADLDGFFELEAASAESWEHTVAWVDCLHPRMAGRGIFSRARFLERSDGSLGEPWGRGPRTVPCDLPEAALSPFTVKAFNAAYWKLHPRGRRIEAAEKFLFPLDALGHWNRIYGRRGFVQFQCVVPGARARDWIAQLIEAIRTKGDGSFLSVLKTFGELPSPGLLSFPRPGVTFALDFPFRGDRTLALMKELEEIVIDAGGALYPAKDACMSPRAFGASFTRLGEFEPWIDPAFSSSFWRRVHAAPRAA
ncbi:MAG TPA: FAD-binding oxidoreductase [Usitatibacter sp.]|nr:FAD-binding oxidoreductase [Usitatibacter sp.]